MEPSRLLEEILRDLPENPDRAGARVERLGAEAVIAAARPLGLVPLLAHWLPGQIPLSAAEARAARFHFARLESLTRLAASTLERAGVPAAVLKGIDFAHRFYPEPWLRPSVDADLLISPKRIDLAIAALTAAGFTPLAAPPRTPFEYSHDVLFHGPRGGQLELHFAAASDFQARIDAERLLERSRREKRGAGKVRVLAENDALLLACVHAAHHAFGGAKWLLDLKLAARAGADWAAVAAGARECRVASAVGMALREAERRVRAPIPPSVVASLPPGAARALLVRGVDRALPEETASLAGSLLLADRVTPALLREAAVRPLGRILSLSGLGPLAKEALWRLTGRFGIMLPGNRPGFGDRDSHLS